MEGSSLPTGRIDRKSSIETEPRTLNMDQIRYAREAALYVMSTKSIEEAMSVFLQIKQLTRGEILLQGLEPVENTRENENRRMEDGEEIQLQYLEDQLQLPALRDIASAPF
ncbi:Coiled-coil domain-containing protein 18, putative isoform 2 [Melia azedarach]|uniref:Coiled-coil domain-containing protein 18, putative isoform 2 n=1 Tax=Melia azedarach TaxID=155640 RepID=A0ACC1XV20_MELAZ|nr:Coiled-coil domain-containing protein 18, putative isoform 2 [Melia azedarach]